jgi:Putative enzyme of poly-gamma-glutamate biosynthesis (capsule formation)
MKISNKLFITIVFIVVLSFVNSNNICGQNNKITFPKVDINIENNIQLFPKHFLKLYDTIKITFIGDVMQHGNQLRSALEPGKNPNKAESYNYKNAFKYIEHYLKDADIAAANMEFTLGSIPYKGYPLFSAPETIAYQAKESGINLFLLANNHILDRGKIGLEKTLTIYDKIGVKYIGAYHNKKEELKNNPVIFNIKGSKIAFINFTYSTNGINNTPPHVINMMDSSHVKECIARAKKAKADIIIAAPHWGEEYKLHPSNEQKEWAKMLLREGVKVIIGSHPHVPQAAEITNEHIIFYSLGNYITNQSNPDYTQLELLVTILLERDNITGKIRLLNPEYDFFGVLKKGNLLTITQ